MLRLIVAHRNNSGLIEQNIGSHQHRILKEPIAYGLLRGGFRFELRHAAQPAHRRDAGQHPGQFAMTGDLRLHHNAGMLRIDSRCQKQRGQLANLCAKFFRLLVNGDSVQIHNAENALVLVLNLDPIADGTQVIADVQIPGRLDAGENTCFHEESPW